MIRASYRVAEATRPRQASRIEQVSKLEHWRGRRRFSDPERFLFIIFLLFFSHLACADAAETTVSFPLDGYFRPGKFVPVEIAHSNQRAAFTLHADGAIDTTGTVEGIIRVPWLIVAPPRGKPEVTVGALTYPIDTPLRALQPHERLVGSTLADARIADELFPDSVAIYVALDPANPLPGPLEAWESLDAVLLDANALTRISDDGIASLLSAGTAIVVSGPAPTNSTWPWERIGDTSILRFRLAGPDSLISQAAYLPTHAWRPEMPQGMRHRIVLYGVIFALLALAASLWKSRWAAALVVVVSTAATALLVGFGGSGHFIHQITGEIRVIDGPLTQIDTWTYQTSNRSTASRFDAARGARPVFASAPHMRAMRMTLTCDPAGNPAEFTYALDGRARVAFRVREIAPSRSIPTVNQRFTSPMVDLARSAYFDADSTIVGQIESRSDAWAGVVGTRSSSPK